MKLCWLESAYSRRIFFSGRIWPIK